MYRYAAAAALLLSLTSASCSHESSSPTGTAESSFTPKPMLPAHALPGEREGAGKADQYDDYRLANPSLYGITAAPQTPLRAVAQFDDHQAMFLTWNGYFPETYSGIIKAASGVVDIYVIHEDFASKSDFQSKMSQWGADPSSVQYIQMSNDSIWVRDYGPLSARAPDGTVAFIDPRYYHQRAFDDSIPTRIASQWGITTFRQPLKWEGGTYQTDGHGNCFYTQGVYWYGGTTVEKIHQYQRDYLGCETNIVLKPLAGEGTTHSDMFSKLAAPDHMVLGTYNASQDSTNKQTLDDDAAILQAATLNDGSKLQVTRIPMPSNSGQSVWRTYANSLFINGINLLPVYSDDTSKQAAAIAIWKSVMPGWTVAPIDSTALITWSGAVHCITMTVPNGTLKPLEPAPASLCGGGFACFPANTQGGSCGASYEGCCTGNTLTSCGPGGATQTVCPGSCGWSTATQSYQCGGQGAGPSAPLECGAACVPSCGGKDCGSDGCGGSCGTCDGTTTCVGGSCVQEQDPCQGVSFTGCCDGSTLKYCKDSQLSVLSCSNGCGWQADQGYYNCGSSGSDPSGAEPKACPGQCVPDCGGKTCGDDGCGGSCGACAVGESCQSGQCACIPTCSGKTCGSDGCGGSCGICPADQFCSPAGACASACIINCNGKTCGSDGCGGSCGACGAGETCAAGACEPAVGCGDLTFQGQCEGTVLSWCQDGQPMNYDCKDSDLLCIAHDGSDPPDYDCLPPANCVPSCAGKSCGGDGCGGVCGVCGNGETCDMGQCTGGTIDPCGGLTWEGCCEGSVLNYCDAGQKQTVQCGADNCGWSNGSGYYDCGGQGAGPTEFPLACGETACQPNCESKICGADGCGGVCGTCTGGNTCQDGECVDGCGDVTYEGTCSGSTLSYCDGGLQVQDCAGLAQGACCGWSTSQGFATCLPVDQCTGCTNACAAGETGCDAALTHAWTCVQQDGCMVRDYSTCTGSCDTVTGACKAGGPVCTPDCSNKQCGTDGCGGSCGTCGAGSSCNASGQCVAACVPDCTDKQCGTDGCGGLCGTCTSGETCKDNQCVPGSCQPKCDGKQCGDDSCGGLCGTCSSGLVCDKVGQCVPESICVPDCNGKACGPDGCGGACGVCEKEAACQEGLCIQKPQNNCGSIPSSGMCDGDVLKFCGDDGQVSQVTCSELGLVCKATPGTGFDCVDPNSCIPNCAGKQCGTNGCGGTCGNCSKSDSCTADGQCVSDTCMPQCDGKVCGADGCGGSCGICPTDMVCDSGLACVEDTGTSTGSDTGANTGGGDTGANTGSDTGANTGGGNTGATTGGGTNAATGDAEPSSGCSVASVGNPTEGGGRSGLGLTLLVGGLLLGGLRRREH